MSSGGIPSSRAASRYGAPSGLYAPARSAVTTTSKAAPTRSTALRPRSSEQLVTTARGNWRRESPGRTSGQGSSVSQRAGSEWPERLRDVVPQGPAVEKGGEQVEAHRADWPAHW